MEKPSYIDPKAVEATLREEFARLEAEASPRATSPARRELVALQMRLLEMNIAGQRTLIEFRNEGKTPLLVAEAMGIMLAQCALGYFLNNSFEANAKLLSVFYAHVSAGLEGRLVSGTVAKAVFVRATTGGNA